MMDDPSIAISDAENYNHVMMVEMSMYFLLISLLYDHPIKYHRWLLGFVLHPIYPKNYSAC